MKRKLPGAYAPGLTLESIGSSRSFNEPQDSIRAVLALTAHHRTATVDQLAVGEDLIATARGQIATGDLNAAADQSALVDRNAAVDHAALVLIAVAAALNDESARNVVAVAPNVVAAVRNDEWVRNAAEAAPNEQVDQDETEASRSVRAAEVFQFDRAAPSRHYDQVALGDRTVRADRSVPADRFPKVVTGAPLAPAARPWVVWWVRQFVLVDRSVRWHQAALAVPPAATCDLAAPDVRFDRRYDQ